MPYFSDSALNWSKSTIGLHGSSASSSKNRSNPAGVTNISIFAGRSPKAVKAWATPRGPTPNHPALALWVLSPIRKSNTPSNTYHDSSSRVWMCGGGPIPGWNVISNSEYAPFVSLCSARYTTSLSPKMRTPVERGGCFSCFLCCDHNLSSTFQ
jgi:hypothetical protein